MVPSTHCCVRVTTARSAMSTSSSLDDKTVVQNMLYRIRQVNIMPPEVESTLLNFTVDGIHLGEVTPKTADLLLNTGPDVFEYKINDEDMSYLSLSDAVGTTYESRTAAVEEVMLQLREQGVVTGWRDEHYPISRGFYEEPVFSMERAAVPIVGAMEYGVHINGLVQQDDGSMKMWMARRSEDKSKYPGECMPNRRCRIARTIESILYSITCYCILRYARSYCGWRTACEHGLVGELYKGM